MCVKGKKGDSTSHFSVVRFITFAMKYDNLQIRFDAST